MIDKIKIIVSIAILAVLFSGCASIVSGTKQRVSINTDPSGARVYVNGKDQNVITPCEIKVPRKRNVVFTFRKEGFDEGKQTLDGQLNPWVFGNLGFSYGFILGGLIDFGTGAWYKYYDDNVFYKFAASDPTVVRGEEHNMVTRDNPGATALERTIIRWYFDSDPKGARIFWRVISSIPNEVKNTNELYLTTTPYEETRSFNILGLTYANSRDVQIEIKVTKPGYEDQVKRYNVREAIDQAEISGFFDLVKKQ